MKCWDSKDDGIVFLMLADEARNKPHYTVRLSADKSGDKSSRVVAFNLYWWDPAATPALRLVSSLGQLRESDKSKLRVLAVFWVGVHVALDKVGGIDSQEQERLIAKIEKHVPAPPPVRSADSLLKRLSVDRSPSPLPPLLRMKVK
jgi:hypothetical protein